MNLFYFLLIGLVAGWLAGQIMKGRGFGLVVNLLLGIAGAIVGGFVFDILGIGGSSLMASLVTSLVGAIILLALIGAVKRK